MAGDYLLCTRSSSHTLQHKLQNALSDGLWLHAHGPLVVAVAHNFFLISPYIICLTLHTLAAF